jgi:hypothetical protein
VSGQNRYLHLCNRARSEMLLKQYDAGHSWMVRRTRPQMRNCASRNLEIPGSMLRIAPEMTGHTTTLSRFAARVMPV